MKVLKRWIPIVAIVLLCGCFQIQDELVLSGDGSGKITIRIHSNLPDELVSAMGSGFGGNLPMYPPISESEARRFFPSKDFNLTTDQKSDSDGKTLIIEASFKDVNALLASHYGRAHQLTLKTNGNGLLIAQALSGGSTLAQAAQFRPEGDMAAVELPGMEDAQKRKNEMRFKFRITLPNTVTSTNGTREGKSVTWTVERAKCKDDEEFSVRLAEVLESNCSSDGLKFFPTNPPRLGLLPFDQLTAGKIGAASALPDTNKIAAAVRFVPYALRVTRTLDLSGESSMPPSQAQLTGAIILPAELAPHRWGAAKLEEALDAKGHNLTPKDDADSIMSRVSRMESLEMGDSNDDDDPEEANSHKTADKPHIVTLAFKAPEWKVTEISRIKGTVELQYLGGSEVIKLTNAVPANLVMDISKRSSGFSLDSNGGRMSEARVGDMRLTFRVRMAMVQSGMTMLQLETGGKASLIDAQVFDSEGRPWPTTLMQFDFGSSGDGNRSSQVMVAGKPKPPFSLALAVSGVGASVSVPILLQNVPIRDK
jgi:LppM domain